MIPGGESRYSDRLKILWHSDCFVFKGIGTTTYEDQSFGKCRPEDRSPMAQKQTIFILSRDEQDIKHLCAILSEGGFVPKAFHRLEDLEAGFKGSDCIAAILDVDSVSLNNRIIRTIKEKFLSVSLFCMSRRWFHPELEDALSLHISACLSKPVDPEELKFWLKSIEDFHPNAASPS
jgi:hypothetical protein